MLTELGLNGGLLIIGLFILALPAGLLLLGRR